MKQRRNASGLEDDAQFGNEREKTLTADEVGEGVGLGVVLGLVEGCAEKLVVSMGLDAGKVLLERIVGTYCGSG